MADRRNDLSLARWDQVVALTVTYRRLLSILFFVPVLSVATPLVLNAAYLICDRLTNNHTILTFALTILATYSVQNMICHLAPTKEDAEEAVAKTEFGLPLILFGFIAMGANIILTPLGEMLGITDILTWAPAVTFSFALHMACGTLFLGLAVVLRYAGPHSILRCSSSPLIAHPVVTKIRTLWSTLSVDAVFDFFVGPSEIPGELYKTPLDHRENARRLQCPTLGDAVAQFIISGLGATAFAYASVLPYSPGGIHGDSPYKALIILSCIFAIWIHLLQSGLDGSSHELNPTHHRIYQWKKRHNILSRVAAVCRSIFTAAVAVPLIATLSSWLISSGFERDDDTVWSVALFCVVTAVLVTIYLHIVDEVLRTLLCTPLPNIRKVVEEIGGDRINTFLDVTMHSILHSDSDLVKELSGSIQPFLRELERRELGRNESAMKAMAKILTQKTAGDEGSARLEEDVLRFYILESLGGASWRGVSYDGFDKAEAYHVENVKQWIQPQDTLKIGQVSAEPLAVRLVRALCAYFGGLGEALVICGGQKRAANLNPWLLPPGAIICAEYAIRAASRCILFNLSHSAQILSDWRSTHLSLLIPVFITSACRLETGILKFIQARNGIKDITLEKFDFVRTESPELLSLFYECNDSVAAILQKLKALEGIRRIDFDLDPVSRKWTEGILAKSS